MKLTPKVVTELTQLRANIKDLQTKEKRLTESLKREMNRKNLDEYAPVDSPYKLVHNEYERSRVSWHHEWKIIAKKVFGKRWKSKEKELQEDSKEPVESLNVEPNERYKK